MGAKQSVVEGANSDEKLKFVHKIFEERLSENVINRPALLYHDAAESVRSTSFNDLNRTANRLAACILEMLRDNDAMRNQDGDYVIAVCMSKNDYSITMLLATWKIGAAYLAIERNLPVNQIRFLVKDAAPTMIICDHYADRSAFENVCCISYEELLAKSVLCEDDNIHSQNSVRCSDDDIAIILYTSGTAGAMKGVRIPHSAVRNKLQWLESRFPFSTSEKVGVLISELSSVDSVAEIWNPLLNGVAVLIVPSDVIKDPSKLVDFLEANKIERLVVTPTLLMSVVNYISLRKECRLSNLKTWMCGGETLTTLSAKKFFRYFRDGMHRLCNFYGSTETMGTASYFVCEDIKELEGVSNVPIGYPLDNTSIFIMNKDLSPVKPGEIGEICVAGSSLARGYVADKEKSKFIPNRFMDNPKFDRLHRTGDFGKLIRDGCIQYEGRMDSQINVRGNLMRLSVIETGLQSIDQVDGGVVVLHHSDNEDQTVLVFAVLKSNFNGLPSDKSQKADEIESVLRSKFGDIENLRVVVIESIPLLLNGKIDRQALIRAYENMTGKSGDSLKSIIAVAQLCDMGYSIRPSDFAKTKRLGDVLDKIFDEGSAKETSTKFKTIPLAMHHKHHVISIITTTFHDGCDLGTYIMERSDAIDHKDFVEQTWDFLIEKDLSFAVMDSDGNIVGVSINKDGQDLPKIKILHSLGIILQFLDSLEKPVLEKRLPNEKKKIFHNYVRATSAKLTPPEKVEAIQKMEEVNLDIARRKGFIGILITNTDLLTQQLASNVYGYETLVDYQVNTYVHRDGTKPFQKAPDTQRVMVQWKSISESNL
ncbi:bacitracin synthase 1-like isoform X2 [Bradysia coprophila]|uniref:bacitracin synthase 1-like isoform X2 n=1 Tax=Bradysia coprophila TaxID=38358 RepID=UPI00187D767E|nr:bacitracin synthase 1-like isoform X2 [Bradysia coprophila]